MSLILMHNAVMALVTYVLLAALYSGLDSRFHPEILGSAASKAFAVVILDLAFIYLGCYFLNIQVRAWLYFVRRWSNECLQGQSQLLDLLAYDGYKFVG